MGDLMIPKPAILVVTHKDLLEQLVFVRTIMLPQILKLRGAEGARTRHSIMIMPVRSGEALSLDEIDHFFGHTAYVDMAKHPGHLVPPPATWNALAAEKIRTDVSVVPSIVACVW